MLPITSIQECNAAAQAIGNSDITAKQTNSSPRPEGCYENKNNGNLWLAINPENQGNGRILHHSQILNPICKTTGLLHTVSISTVKKPISRLEWNMSM